MLKRNYIIYGRLILFKALNNTFNSKIFISGSKDASDTSLKNSISFNLYLSFTIYFSVYILL